MYILALYKRFITLEMCMLLPATSTHFKWELMLYCLHCPTLNKVFLLLLFLLLLFKSCLIAPKFDGAVEMRTFLTSFC